MLRMPQPLCAEEKVTVWDGQFHDREMRPWGSVQSRICGHAAHPVSPWVYPSLSVATPIVCFLSPLCLWQWGSAPPSKYASQRWDSEIPSFTF
jgi:hypothetical protein